MNVRTPISTLFKITYCKSLYLRRLDAFHNKVRARPCMGRDLNDGILVRHQLLTACTCAKPLSLFFFFLVVVVEEEEEEAKRRYEFLGAFAKLRKATVSFFSTACPSVCAHGTTRFPPDGLP